MADGDSNVYCVRDAIDHLCQKNKKCSSKLRWTLSKQIWSPDDRSQLMESLSQLFLDTHCTADICLSLQSVILGVAEKCKQNVLEKGSNIQFQRFAIVLSIGLQYAPDLKKITIEFLNTHKPFSVPCVNPGDEPKKKKKKKDKLDDLDVVRAMWVFVKELGSSLENSITLDLVLPYLSHSATTVRWYESQTVCEMLHMSSQQRAVFFSKYFTEEEVHSLSVRFQLSDDGKCSRSSLVTISQTDSKMNYTMQGVVAEDFGNTVVEVAGILLPKLQGNADKISSTDLVPVPSTMSNLRSLALAVVSGAPVLLQGPVGSGKTTLVEHLATLTGRQNCSKFLKIQLGDQTDSKALLGTYRCTEVPGEFVWQPGILTRAVTEGLWVLLEDIDFAPMDVVSILLPLLETNTLAVPGHGDNIRASPNFRLFATQRLIGSSSGWHRQKSGSSLLLEKMWTRISVEPLSHDELKKVVVSRFPRLATVVDKLLDIYLMLSAGKHDTDLSGSDSAGRFLSLAGRLVSTRDLMTWVSRVSQDFEVSSAEAGPKVFQEALDCFVSALPKLNKRLPLAEAIGAKLNVSNVKAEFYTCKYKPHVEISDSSFTAGRVVLPRKPVDIMQMTRMVAPTFAFTRQSVSLLEKVAVCVSRTEPVLLVGETGTGKTSSVQYLAHQLGHKLHVINLNQQSDSTDLLGGFKPVDLKFVIMPFREDFEMLFIKTFSRKQNAKFLGHIQDCFSKRRWSDLLTLMEHTQASAVQKFSKGSSEQREWKAIGKRLHQLQVQVKQIENALAFSFIEGTLVKALRAGDWVLLDEINLAAAETLECLSGLLESASGSVVLTERGDIEPVVRHKDFRLFACMNPATDVGKKDLTPGIRNRFTELFVDELEDPADLKILVNDYLKGLSLSSNQVDGIVNFYLLIRAESSKHLTDGTGHKPHFSLRTFCRALKFASSNPCGGVSRSLYEGFCLSFLTQLDRPSHPIVEKLVCQHIIGKANVKGIIKQPLPAPPGGKHLNFEGYWISKGALEPHVPENYILTPSVRENLRDLARVISAGQHPVLIQGETSVGKTSLITWLAQCSGNPCVRVNNHEHTDLQEYVGCYAADETGKLVFKEGVLVEAMRKGHWIILDELNLAPTDVLEALNRLLDDNRELFIPETQETVKAHPKFMLFATQNPPGLYGGRKILSRAFKNRFIELHFSEIPSKELETILHQRCNIPQSYAKRLVNVMLELQMRRRGSGVFAGKQGFMTLRDLFRWADRYSCSDQMTQTKFYDWDQHLADQGYMLLAGRVRKQEETAVIQEVLKKHLKRDVNSSLLFDISAKTSTTTSAMLKQVTSQSVEGFHHIVWTHDMRRLAVLIGQAIKFKEPVLLVGETGCGKTTMCQLYAAMAEHRLHSVNCHLHTESADFLGGLRPVRIHSDDEDPKEAKLFEWMDGPLVTAMKEGNMFLIDEISLADDSVLERLNSVLEPEQTLLLAEKGGGDGDQNEVQQVKATGGFQVFATMNPGGDFGKKELSPALRNRFTEIWCPQLTRRSDLEDIIEHNISDGLQLNNQQDGTSGFGAAIMDFIEWFSNNEIGKKATVSIRDILTWVHFINTCARPGWNSVAMETEDVFLESPVAYVHGACLVFLDSLGAGVTSRGSDFDLEHAQRTCMKFLLQQISDLSGLPFTMYDLHLAVKSAGKIDIIQTDECFSIPPFKIPKGDVPADEKPTKYALQAPTTCMNAQRILRALQLSRPLLLEGSPGVGKTSLVTAIAKAAGRELTRINLSEQTDVTDLFGADLPVEGAEGGRFAWRDGPLLQALKAGHWVVLDELNLASQSVLEGLNACLDHRAEVYIPELGRTFTIQHEKTRLFACQNPLNQGGGRKGLPRSFLNRFTQVYVEPLSREDLMFIASSMYVNIPSDILAGMVDFNMAMHKHTMVESLWGHRGGPWEFNLRDLFRWCDLLLTNQITANLNPGEYVKLVYMDRMRTLADREKVTELYRKCFVKDMTSSLYTGSRYLNIGTNHIQIGHAFLPRIPSDPRSRTDSPLQLLHHHLEPLESIATCVQMNWMAILVGSQSCGKTSMVRLLSEVTGNTLQVLPMNSAMDTTELLGGFEQADIFRQLEEVAAEISKIVKVVQRSLLCDRPATSSASAQLLEQEWIAYNTVTSQGARTSTLEEVENLRVQVKSLESLMALLLKVCRHNNVSSLAGELEEIQTSLESLRHKTHQENMCCGGGTFEWVDSLLVRALQKGHWLLIDNVNFCSPSVLDRLNALLEPGGVLSINERGVIDGQIPTIVPHRDFRLFLAMDPKFGEISRAMRNRGIEIYIPGEDDGCAYSDTDTKKMMKGLGLNDKKICDWLLNLHNQMKERLPRNEQPMIVDLLCAAVTTVQQLERGVTTSSALYHSANDIYVRSLKTVASKQAAKDILNQHLTNLPDVLTGRNDSELGLWPLSVPGSLEYSQDSPLANISHQAGVLVHLVSQLQSSQSDSLSVTKQTTMLRTGIELLMSRLPEKDLQMAAIWVQNLVPNLVSNVTELSSTQSNYGWAVKDYVNALPQVFSDCLKSLAKLTFVNEHRSALHDLCGEKADATSLVLDQPWQIDWNPHLLQKLFASCQSHELDTNQVTAHLKTLTYKSTLLLHLTLMFQDLQPMMRKLKEDAQNASQKRMSPVVTALVHLSNMYAELLSGMSDYLDGLSHITEDNFTQLLSSFPWLCRLLCVTQRWRKMAEDQFQCQLALHWNWFHNKTLTHLASLGNSSTTNLGSAVTQLQRLLGQENMTAKMFERFWTDFGHPEAFISEEESHLTQIWQELQALVNVYGDSAEEMVKLKVKVMRSHGLQIRKLLMDVAADIRKKDYPDDAVLQKIENVKTLLKSFGLQLGSDLDKGEITTTPLQSEKLPVCHVELWPLFEHLSLLSQLNLLSTGDYSLSHFMDYNLYYTPDIPMHIEHAHNSQDADRGAVNVFLTRGVLDRLWTSTASQKCLQWLLWNRQIDQHQDTEDTLSGPGMLQRSAVSYFSFHLLSQDTVSETELLPVHVPLKEVHQQLEGFALLSRHLWCHAATLARADHDIRHIAKEYLLTTFLHLMQSLKCLLNAEDRNQMAAILDDLDLLVKQKTLSSADLRKAHICFQCVSDSIESAAVPVMNRGFEILQDLIQEEEDSSSLVGHGLVYIGLTQMILLAPRGPVDPVEKQAVKLQHVTNELAEVEAEIEVIQLQSRLLIGRELDETEAESHSHPIVRYLQRRLTELKQKKGVLETTQVYRPTPSQFILLVQDTQSFLQSVGSTSHITGLLSKMRSLHQTLLNGQHDALAVTTSLRQESVWQTTVHRFISKLEREYPCYRDLLDPFIMAIQQVSFGMRLIAQEVELTAHKTKWFENARVPEQVVSSLSRFPSVHSTSPNLLHLVETVMSTGFLKAVQGFVSLQHDDAEDASAKEKEIQTRLLMTSLDMVKTHSFTTKELSAPVTFTLSRLFDLCLQAWQEQEERRRMKELEEESLYRYKEKTHGDERTEEEREDEEFKSSFPSFHREFEDMPGMMKLEGSGDKQDDTVACDTFPESISDIQMCHIHNCHQQMFSTLTETNWIRRGDDKNMLPVDHVTSALNRYKMAAALCKMGFRALDNRLDAEILGSHILVCGSVESTVTGNNTSMTSPPPPALYNIYTDPNVAEVIQCRPVLDRFMARVAELQQEWPEHPTLKLLEKIVERVMSFPVTSPVMKFLAGLELILEKSQDWEANAASHVSMATQLADVTTMIIQWRKLELSCWSRSLDTEVEKIKNKTSKWWFHIYQLVMSYLSPQQGEAAEPSAQEVLKSLEQFMETSSIGEFQTRLQMILAFHCQVANMDASTKQGVMLNMLWNVYQFYRQFEANIDEDLAKQRAPIERELKGFVKIARWNDMNYWALKQTTEKTHRTVHKHSKAFQGILQQPVQGLLTEKEGPTPGYGETSCVEKLQEYHKMAVERMKREQKQVVELPPAHSSLGSLQQRLSTLTLRVRKHWSKTLTRLQYTGLVTVLDEFTGEIIEGVHELQTSEPTPGLDKDRLKSEAKLMNLRKRKALADLFRHLTTSGLSYRKGLTLEQESQNAMLQSPIDLAAAEESCLSGIWEDCLKYYYRCVARKAKFDTALHTPSKELGMGNIERCRGFVEHLMNIFLRQQSQLTVIFDKYTQLKGLTGTLGSMKSSNAVCLPPQETTKEWIGKFKDLSVNVLEGLSQFLVLMDACPKRSDAMSYFPSPYPPDKLSPLALVHYGDEQWLSCMEKTKGILTVAQTQQDRLLKIDSICYQWKDISVLQEIVQHYEKFIPELSKMSSLFHDPVSDTGSCLNQTLDYLGSGITNLCQEFTSWSDVEVSRKDEQSASEKSGDKVSTDLGKFSDGIEGAIAAMLLAVQNLVKVHEEEKTEKEDVAEVDEEGEEEPSFQEGHLTTLLMESVTNDVKLLQSNKVLEFVLSLVNVLKSMVDGESQESAICLRQLLRCYPMLHQFVQMTEYYVAQLTGLFRTTGKLLSVLLSLFTELATKGFCIPPELSDEMGEGATEFEDITGGGLGEGQGAKDVSDQIETEDQLDEMKKAEESKDKPEDNNIPAEDNAIEMSEDFDGKMDDSEMKGEDSEDEEPDPDDLDKQMGDVDSKETDRLDEQMWGSDQEEETEDQEQQEKEESGPGAEQESEAQIVAKDDNSDKTDADDDNKKSEKDEPKDGEEENNEEQKPHEMEEFDEAEYDEDKVDPQQGNQGPEQEPEALDLPDDLNLDENEAGKGEEETAPPEVEHGEDGDEEGEEEKVDEQMDIPELDEKKEEEQIEEQNENAEDKDEDEGKEKDAQREEGEEEGKEDEGKGESGISPQDDDEEEKNREAEEKQDTEDTAEGADERGKTSHDTADVEMTDAAQDDAATGDNEQKEQHGTGVSQAEEQEGHEGDSSAQVTEGSDAQRKTQFKRRPGQSDENRSLGSKDEKYKKLKTVDKTSQDSSDKEERPKRESNLYEHIKDSTTSHDAQTLDVATNEQQEEQPVANQNEEVAEPMGEDDDMDLRDEKQEDTDMKEVKDTSSNVVKDLKQPSKEAGDEKVEGDGEKMEVEGEKVVTYGVERGPESTIHTVMEHLHLDTAGLVDIDEDKLRAELEENVTQWSHDETLSAQAVAAAAEAWQQYDALTSGLAQDLCEQLRLVLEPSQATKLKGDYRTGKRLNMRKVIPYIASQFRKDKIWLRRTKPSKRQYQIMLAIDDSSSMIDNHSKQLAFESLAMISNALTLLESGELAVCSFGESVRQLHSFSEQFTNQSGASILQHFSFEQKKTKIAQLMKEITPIMLDSRRRQHGGVGQSETSQLLLIVSDGRGLFVEGMEAVQSAVRQAREANVFIVFVIIDNPQSKDSILDIKVPIFKGAGQLPEIRSYMESFPFPFYIILRDINSLPQTLSDALRQWFELVTAGDRT